MSDQTAEKDHGVIDKVRETTGIYHLGFERESFLGLMAPFVVVIGLGGILGAIIYWVL